MSPRRDRYFFAFFRRAQILTYHDVISTHLGQQANVATGTRRAIRRADVAWRWEDDGGVWRAYDHAISRALEAARRDMSPVAWANAASGQQYRIDWSSAAGGGGPLAQVKRAGTLRRVVCRNGAANRIWSLNYN